MEMVFKNLPDDNQRVSFTEKMEIVSNASNNMFIEVSYENYYVYNQWMSLFYLTSLRFNVF